MSNKSKQMSNLDFLLNCIYLDDVTKKTVDGNIVVTGFFNGSDDLSWYEMEYVFDKDGNYISHKEIDCHR